MIDSWSCKPKGKVQACQVAYQERVLVTSKTFAAPPASIPRSHSAIFEWTAQGLKSDELKKAVKAAYADWRAKDNARLQAMIDARDKYNSCIDRLGFKASQARKDSACGWAP